MNLRDIPYKIGKVIGVAHLSWTKDDYNQLVDYLNVKQSIKQKFFCKKLKYKPSNSKVYITVYCNGKIIFNGCQNVEEMAHILHKQIKIPIRRLKLDSFVRVSQQPKILSFSASISLGTKLDMQKVCDSIYRLKQQHKELKTSVKDESYFNTKASITIIPQFIYKIPGIKVHITLNGQVIVSRAQQVKNLNIFFNLLYNKFICEILPVNELPENLVEINSRKQTAKINKEDVLPIKKQKIFNDQFSYVPTLKLSERQQQQRLNDFDFEDVQREQSD